MSTDNNTGAPTPAPMPEPAQPAPQTAPVHETAQPQEAPAQEAAPAPAAPAQEQSQQPAQAAGQEQNQSAGAGRGPSHIAYHVREVGEDKSYFNRVGSAFEHKDGEGYNVILDALPVDGKLTLRTPKERLNDLKEGKAGKGDRGHGR